MSASIAMITTARTAMRLQANSMKARTMIALTMKASTERSS